MMISAFRGAGCVRLDRIWLADTLHTSHTSHSVPEQNSRCVYKYRVYKYRVKIASTNCSAGALQQKPPRASLLPFPSTFSEMLASAWTWQGLEQLLASFDATATELLLRHSLRPSDLNARMRRALEAASAGMPRLPVLYCGSYGDYAMEDGFQSFLESTCSLSPLRTGRSMSRPYESYNVEDTVEGDAEAEVVDMDMEEEENSEVLGQDEGPEDGEVVACPQLQPGACQHSGVLPQPPSSPARMQQEEEEAAPAHVPTLATLCIAARMRSSNSRPGSSSSTATTYIPGGVHALDRMLDAHMLIPFGRALAAEWPFIAHLLRAYHSPGGPECMEHLRAAEKLVSSRRTLAAAISTHKRLAAALAPGAGWVFGGRGWTPDSWSSSAACIRRELDKDEERAAWRGQGGEGQLTRAAVEEMRRSVDQEVTQLTSDVAGMAAALEAVPFADAMLVSASAGVAGKAGREMGDKERPCFLQAVAQHGEQHPGIWSRQKSFDEGLMQHLARCPQHVAHLLQDQGQGAADEVLMNLAICAGSGRCQLRVQLVPQLSEWCIDEYDGLESVRLV